MANSPSNLELDASFALLSTDEQPSSHKQSPPSLNVPHRPPSRLVSETQYEFIMQSGAESATATKQKLKTVRSHVMKNYLHQQQYRNETGDPLYPVKTKTRRRSKQRARSSRSTSIDEGQSPTRSGNSPSASHLSGTEPTTSIFYFLGPLFELRSEYANDNGEYILLAWYGMQRQVESRLLGRPRASFRPMIGANND